MNIFQLTRNARRAGRNTPKHTKKIIQYAQQLAAITHLKNNPVRSSVPKKKQRLASYGLVEIATPHQ